MTDNINIHRDGTAEKRFCMQPFSKDEILALNGLGLWIILIDEKNGINEMFIDQTMQGLMGSDSSYTSEECYEHWHSRINNGYYDYVNRSVNHMITTGENVQLQYTWKHPDLGDVIIRCTGIRTEDVDGCICLKGYHQIVNELEETKFLTNSSAEERFEYDLINHSIYFHTKRQHISGSDISENNFPQCWIFKNIVHPHFQEKFLRMFSDCADPSEDNEIMLLDASGNYSWFKICIRHLGDTEIDRNMLVVQLKAANIERRMELEHMRLLDFYHASLSEVIAYAEIDMESKQILDSGGLWAGYEHIQIEYFSKYLDFNGLIHSDTTTHRTTFKYHVKGKLCWVELVAHVFKEQFSNNTYCLIYLKNIDEQKRKEISQREAAESDPLTGLFNRNAFQIKMEQFLKTVSDDGAGAFMIIDIDDFKNINDTYGHPAGDEVLKYVAKCLSYSFSQSHMTARYGGDEFLVLITEPVDKDALCNTMDGLFENLMHHSLTPILCSVGIKLLGPNDSSYPDIMQDADRALYLSKERGKHCYTIC